MTDRYEQAMQTIREIKAKDPKCQPGLYDRAGHLVVRCQRPGGCCRGAKPEPVKLMQCGDCLAVKPFDEDGHNEVYFCECGGQWCGCDACNSSAHDAMKGAPREKSAS